MLFRSNDTATTEIYTLFPTRRSSDLILSVLGEGTFFGEMALLDDEPRSAHVIAMEDATLLVLRREDFHAKLRQSPEVAISLLREISRRLRRADEKIGSLVLLDVNGRVAHLLLRMAEDGTVW